MKRLLLVAAIVVATLPGIASAAQRTCGYNYQWGYPIWMCTTAEEATATPEPPPPTATPAPTEAPAPEPEPTIVPSPCPFLRYELDVAAENVANAKTARDLAAEALRIAGLDAASIFRDKGATPEEKAAARVALNTAYAEFEAAEAALAAAERARIEAIAAFQAAGCIYA